MTFRGISPKDEEGPTVKSVAVLSLTSLLVTFSEPVLEGAEDPENYQITADNLTYDFGGIGTPDGSYKGSQLELGAFDIAFNDPPLAVGNKTCLVEVTVQVKVE